MKIRTTLAWLALCLALPINGSAETMAPLATKVAEAPLTVLIVPPAEASMNERQRVLYRAIQPEIQARLAQSFSTLAASAGAALSERGKLQTLLADTLRVLAADLEQLAKRTNSQLTVNDKIIFMIYLTPWLAKDMNEIPAVNVPAINLPFKILMVDLNKYDNKPEQDDPARKDYSPFYHKLRIALETVRKDPAANASHFNFQAATVGFKLARDDSTVQIQVLGSLKSSVTPFAQKNEEVDIHAIEIPVSKDPLDRPLALATLRQRIGGKDHATEKPTMTVDLGRFGRFSDGLGHQFAGELQIFRNPGTNGCDEKMDYVPALVGKTEKNAMPKEWIGKLVQGSNINFHIFRMEVDPTVLQITKMDIRLKIGLKIAGHDTGLEFSCFSIDSVNGKFTKQINDAIQAKLNSFYKQDDRTEEILNFVYTNQKQ